MMISICYLNSKLWYTLILLYNSYLNLDLVIASVLVNYKDLNSSMWNILSSDVLVL